MKRIYVKEIIMNIIIIVGEVDSSVPTTSAQL